MSEYFSDLQNEIGYYYIVLKFTIYFLVGSIFLILINNIVKFFSFMFSKFSKQKFMERLNFIFKLLIFILVSTFLGWTLIYIAF